MITEKSSINRLIIKDLGFVPYVDAWEAMRAFTAEREEDTNDELWLLEHEPVLTQGQAGRAEHILNPHAIPLVQTDRGGQVTYHGPGQLMIYTLLDIKRLRLDVRELVTTLEEVVLNLLSHFSIHAHARKDAPGVYVKQSKICSIGLRVRRGCCYHGLALNVAMDLTPFTYINPCGYQGLQMTQIADWVESITMTAVKQRLIESLAREFNYHLD